MTQAEELLNSLTPDDIALYTAKPGIEDHIIIDDNRNITVPDMLKRIAVQYDNCIETVTFDCPRYWDENDLSTMNIYINYVRSDSVGGLYLAKNIRVDEEDSNIIHFDWLIGDEITIVSGALQFAISAKKMGEDEELRWYSEINTQMTVSKGLDNAEIVVEEHPDILNEILDKVDNMTVDNDVKTAISTLQTDLDALENKVDNFDIPEQVQVDWNQNDETQPDYIKNRVCYSEVLGEIETTIIEQGTKQCTVSDYGDVSISEYYLTEDEKYELNGMSGYSGKFYLTVDGKSYEQYVDSIDSNLNVSFSVSFDSYTVNFVLTNELIGITTDLKEVNMGLNFIATDENIIKLPEKYLPDTVATKQYVDDIFNSIVNGDEVSY